MNNLVRPFITIFTIFLLVFSASALPLQNAYAEGDEPPLLLWSFKEAKFEKEVAPPGGSWGMGGIPFQENEAPLFVALEAEIVPSYVPVEIEVWAAWRGKGGEPYTVTVMRNVAKGLHFFNSTSFFPPLAGVESIGFSVHNPNQVDVIVSVHFLVGYSLSEPGVPLENYTSLNSAYSMLQSEYYELSSRYNSLQTTYYQHTFILATVSIALACTSVALAVRRRRSGSEKRELKRNSDQAEGDG